MVLRRETFRLILLVCIIVVVCALATVKKSAVEAFVQIDHEIPRAIPTWSGNKIPYSILQIEDRFSKQECDHVINYMSTKVKRSTVIGSNGESDVTSNVRTSSSGWIKHSDPLMHNFVRKFIYIGSQLSGFYDMNNYEDISIVRYQPSQFYKEHYDSCSTKTRCGSGNRVYRVATLILYLNDNFEGGQTRFPKIDTNVEPKTGKLLYFYDTHRNGVEIDDSIHAGLPVASGEKWIATLWIKFNPDGNQIEVLNGT